MILPEDKLRYEFKYIFKRRYLRPILSYLYKIGLRKDKNMGLSDYYCVTSLYFDTSFLRDYFEKQFGLKDRRKLRIRTYNNTFDNHDLWMEIKNKEDMVINKKRMAMERSLWHPVLNGKPRKVSVISNQKLCKEINNEFLYHFYRYNYKPQVVVRYKRTAFVSRFLSKIRLTLDYDIQALSWREFKENRQMLNVAPDNVVIEVKFMYAMPWWFTDLARRFNFHRLPFSKYSNAIDTINKHYPIPK